jgi:chromosome segregation ATPase
MVNIDEKGNMNNQNDDLSVTNDVDQLDAGDDQDLLQSGEDLALEALNKASGTTTSSSDDDEELASSDDLAETLASLQRVIERSAEELDSISQKLKEKRDSLKNVFDNDAPLAEAKEQVDLHTTQLKERRTKLQADPQVTTLKVQIGEINEQKKELEETLSNHLLNYYSLTNSTSFDTSDGDQWDFTVKAKVKGRKNKGE